MKEIKRRGFRARLLWKQFVVDSNGRPAHPPKMPKEWTDKSVSDCTVRTQKKLRDLLKDQLDHENRRLSAAGQSKLKEVDSVNAALYGWICQSRAKDLITAEEVILVFSSGFDLNQVIGILGRYPSYIEKISYREKKKLFPRSALYLTFKRQLLSSSAFKRDLGIVASLVTTYEVIKYRNFNK